MKRVRRGKTTIFVLAALVALSAASAATILASNHATTIRAGSVAAIVTLAVTWNIPAAAGLFALTFLAPAVAGKVLRSRSYLNWLAYANKAKPGELRTVLQRLEMVAVRDRDSETRKGLQQLIPVVNRVAAQPR